MSISKLMTFISIGLFELFPTYIFTFVLKSSSQTLFIFWKKVSSCSSIFMLTIRIPIWVLYAEFSWYWPYGFGEGEKMWKNAQGDGRTDWWKQDKGWSENFTWFFFSGWLKRCLTVMKSEVFECFNFPSSK